MKIAVSDKQSKLCSQKQEETIPKSKPKLSHKGNCEQINHFTPTETLLQF